MIRNLAAFPRHYLVACIVNSVAVVWIPTLGLRVIANRLSDAWLIIVMALLMAGWGIGISIIETFLLYRTSIRLPWQGFARLLAGFLAGGLLCYIGYLLAASTFSMVLSGQTPHLTATILLSIFGVIGISCWGVGLIIPLLALRRYLNEQMGRRGRS